MSAILGFSSETRRLFKLAIPILLAQLASVGMGVTDTLMSSWVGVTDLAAIGLGTGIMIPLFLVASIVLLALSPLVANANERSCLSDLKAYFNQAPIIALFFGVLAMLLSLSPQPVLNLLSLEPELYRITEQYLFYIAFGLPAVAFYSGLRFYWEGMGTSLPTMWISWIGLLLNIPLNAIFIFGVFGFEGMGAVGCGVATALTWWIMFFLAVAYVYRSHWALPLIAQIQITDFLPNFTRQLQILKIGVPAALAILFEVTLFTLIALFIAPFGESVIASHQVAMNITALLFMLPLSVAMAATVTVGRAHGSNDLQQIKTALQTSLLWSLMIGCTLALVSYFGRIWAVGLYTDVQAVFDVAVTLMLFAVAYQIFDSIQANIAGILRGFTDTIVPMWMTLFSYWVVGLGVGSLLGYTNWLTQEPLGVYGFWVGIVLGLFTAFILLMLRLRWFWLQLSRG